MKEQDKQSITNSQRQSETSPEALVHRASIGYPSFWLSYGAGVNSTALAILLCRGQLPQYEPWRIIFADTGEEKPETYRYVERVFSPWLERRGKTLEIVKPAETVLDRWERLKVTGSRIVRSCTVEAKINPIKKHEAANGGGTQLIGIDSGEAHRMPDKVRPLVDLGIDRDQCKAIIQAEGLLVPPKSGCWCCPFLRVGEAISLCRYEPEKFARIERLENIATETHGRDKYGRPRTQWGDQPAAYWRERASQGLLFEYPDIEMPCGCYDG